MSIALGLLSKKLRESFNLKVDFGLRGDGGVVHPSLEVSDHEMISEVAVQYGNANSADT